ncbi:hypothetical protein WJX81_000106 [Elliptochloris bilobata]|uniref:Nascent polypeptide-associated complex subunit alpha-like UBA domain-containing protein n=1 Tax=Elliptochloris bilobata TaxID=381761 RepID=A0AAW1SGU4_9CHLO
MASDASERAQRRLEQPSEALLAELITREAAMRQEAAAEHGLTALLRKPLQRERPNERFLQGTLRSVAFANRRQQEDAMWGARRKQLDERGIRTHGEPGSERPRTGGKQQIGRSSSRSAASSDGSPSSASGSASSGGGAAPAIREGALGDDALSEMLSKRAVRGRGAVGPRADEPGPYLPAGAAPAYPLLFDDGPPPAARQEERKKGREEAEQSKALDTLTDHVEERELDHAKAEKAMANLNAAQQAKREAQLSRDKELSAVKLRKEDIELIMKEYEIEKKLAERRLREHSGNLRAALESFL